jgi:ABC-2 type transport system permease protein
LNNFLDKLGIVIKYEFLKHVRRKRLYIILGIALLAEALGLILVPTLLTGGYPDSVKVMAYILSIGPGLAAIGAVFFAGDAIAGEFEGKTGFLLFTNPIKRDVLWVGKYLASLLAVVLMIIFTYIIVAISLAIIYHQVPIGILGSFGMCILYASAVLSLTFLFSAVSKGAMGATIMTLLFIWVLSNIVQSILGLTNNPYWFMISAGSDSITLPYGSIKDIMSGLGIGGGQFGGGGFGSVAPLTIGMAIWGMMIYIIGGFVSSILISRRRQLS